MRTISAIVLTSIATLTLAACGSSQSASSAEKMNHSEPAPTAQRADYSRDVAPMQSSAATLTVRGLSCPKCANNVTKQLQTVAGVSTVDVNMGDGLVNVTFIDGLHPSRAQLAQAIDKSGFTLVDIAAN